MSLKRLFTVNALIAVGYAAAFFGATGNLLAVYGIAQNPEGVFMARWFGVGLLAGWIAVGFNLLLGSAFALSHLKMRDVMRSAVPETP